MEDKLILYVDQNLISNLAKATASPHRDKNSQKEYTQLYEELLKLVWADKIICPGSSEFYHLEGTQYPSLLTSIQAVATRLGFGVWFRPFVRVIFGQASIALRAFVSGEHADYSSRLTAFYTDPLKSISELGFQAPGRQVEPKWGPAWSPASRAIPKLKQAKLDFASHLNSAHAQAAASRLTTAKQFALEKRGFIEQVFKVPLVQQIAEVSRMLKGQKPSVASLLNPDPRSGPGFKLYREFEKQVNAPGDVPFAHLDDFNGFLDSDVLANIPFIRVYTAAGTDSRHGGRPVKGSDLFDWGIAALVIPYVNVFVTDSALADTIRRVHIQDDYKIEVFADSSTGRQDLRAMLTSLA